jgi:hypothetical protein
MVLSGVLAFLIPFKLFLFSYAVLGPLHYLTEISWLEKRSFFLPNKKDYFFILLCGGFLFLLYLFGYTIPYSGYFITLFFIIAFLGALLLSFVKSRIARLVGFVLITALAAVVSNFNLAFVLFAVLLPTVIHVFVFTGSFILFGALKSKSKTGLLSVFVYIGVFVALLLLTISVGDYGVTSFIKDAYRSFEGVNLEIMNLLNITSGDIQYSIYQSSAGLSIMRFIAFAYTYHYLNWFSKTKIIRWHEVSRKKLDLIFIIWAVSVGVYVWNYQTGLVVLYFLSMIHVLLEFPLNHHSFVGIYQNIKDRILKLV